MYEDNVICHCKYPFSRRKFCTKFSLELDSSEKYRNGIPLKNFRDHRRLTGGPAVLASKIPPHLDVCVCTRKRT